MTSRRKPGAKPRPLDPEALAQLQKLMRHNYRERLALLLRCSPFTLDTLVSGGAVRPWVADRIMGHVARLSVAGTLTTDA